MASTVVDLTGDYSSDAGPCNENPAALLTKSTTMTKGVNRGKSRETLETVKNGALKETRSSVSEALGKAIDSLSKEHMRLEIHYLCGRIEGAHQALRERLLIHGKNVIRYHANTDSEDAADSGDESEEDSDEDESDGDGRNQNLIPEKILKPIAIRDEEFTPRFATCENCEEEFDVTANLRGDCTWHTGMLHCFSKL